MAGEPITRALLPNSTEWKYVAIDPQTDAVVGRGNTGLEAVQEARALGIQEPLLLFTGVKEDKLYVF